jgi:hypothetical protein
MKTSFWLGDPGKPPAEALFRLAFKLDIASRVEFLITGASWYQAWLDGPWLLEGPLRYAPGFPEYQVAEADLPAGPHVLAFHARHDGVETRILKDLAPYLWCHALVDGREVRLDRRAMALGDESPVDPAQPQTWEQMGRSAQLSGRRRINPQLGWNDCCDTRLEPLGWREVGFDDAAWSEPASGVSAWPEPTAAKMSAVRSFHHVLRPMAEGPLANTFGYPSDDPSHGFHSRDRQCRDLPAKGVWRRYDLGRVRLGRAALTLDVPAGSVVEIAQAEALSEGRVSPYINFSLGGSCSMDRFIARGGEQTFTPLVPKGGRFVEVHVVNARDGVRFIREEYIERGYYEPTGARFSCGDPLLEKIWITGVETLRACAEDAVTDNPTRERGEWVGDALVALETAAVAFHDLRLCRRALVHAAQCAREDGLVAGMAPGGCCYMTTYAFLWTVAAVHDFRHTGTRDCLEELWPYALRNMAAVEAFTGAEGMRNEAGQIFVDWGYSQAEPVDPAANLFYVMALRAMVDWATALGHDPASFARRESELSAQLATRLRSARAAGGWEAVGYHCAALGLRLGLIPEEDVCLDFLASHLLRCFPNDPAAPRNDDPFTVNPRVITPYFAHYVMPLFIERGRMDFVLDQYRACWGWMLEGGRTTWLELFETRLSHCHQWSACPTWQLSRYVLGLHPRLDLGSDVFDFRLEPGSLPQASGRLPHPAGGWIGIEWERTGENILYSCTPESALELRRPGERPLRMAAGQKVAWSIQPASLIIR